MPNTTWCRHANPVTAANTLTTRLRGCAIALNLRSDLLDYLRQKTVYLLLGPVSNIVEDVDALEFVDIPPRRFVLGTGHTKRHNCSLNLTLGVCVLVNGNTRQE